MVDEPVVITGGSVKLKISDKFKDDGTEPGKKKLKLDGQKLQSLWVNNEKVRDLTDKDTVKIISDDTPAA